MIIGDGFSAGLRRHLGAANSLNANQLFPVLGSPSHTTASGEPSVETQHDGLGDFAELESSWKEYVASCGTDTPPSLHGFCLRFADAIPFEAGTGEMGRFFGMKFSGPQFELRVYLWRLFRWHHDQVWRQESDELIKTWAWLKPVEFLGRRTRFTAISYNYDCNLEGVLSKLKLQVHRPIEKCIDAYVNRPGHLPVVIKPHGCLFRSTLAMIGNGIDEIQFVNSNGFSRPASIGLRVSPTFPDLVPPGQDLRQHANPWSDALQAACLAVSDSDLLIVFGFSANQPDDKEFSQLLSGFRQNTPIIHVGLEADRHTLAAKLLRARSSRYWFCNARYASNVMSLPQRVIELTQWNVRTVQLPHPDTAID